MLETSCGLGHWTGQALPPLRKLLQVLQEINEASPASHPGEHLLIEAVHGDIEGVQRGRSESLEGRRVHGEQVRGQAGAPPQARGDPSEKGGELRVDARLVTAREEELTVPDERSEAEELVEHPGAHVDMARPEDAGAERATDVAIVGDVRADCLKVVLVAHPGSQACLEFREESVHAGYSTGTGVVSDTGSSQHSGTRFEGKEGR